MCGVGSGIINAMNACNTALALLTQSNRAKLFRHQTMLYLDADASPMPPVSDPFALLLSCLLSSVLELWVEIFLKNICFVNVEVKQGICFICPALVSELSYATSLLISVSILMSSISSPDVLIMLQRFWIYFEL